MPPSWSERNFYKVMGVGYLVFTGAVLFKMRSESGVAWTLCLLIGVLGAELTRWMQQYWDEWKQML